MYNFKFFFNWKQLHCGNVLTNSKIKEGTFTGHNSYLLNTNIGKMCSIGWNVSIGGRDHNMNSVLMYPDTYWEKIFGISIDPERRYNTLIGHGVWISSGVTILSGVSVGNGAIIGAGAVVTKDVEPYDIVVGVPGKTIRKRFEKKTIDVLESSKWWDWPLDILKDNAHLLSKNLNDKDLSKIIFISKNI